MRTIKTINESGLAMLNTTINAINEFVALCEKKGVKGSGTIHTSAQVHNEGESDPFVTVDAGCEKAGDIYQNFCFLTNIEEVLKMFDNAKEAVDAYDPIKALEAKLDELKKAKNESK